MDNVTSRTGLKLEDATRKVDSRSEWRTTIHRAINRSRFKLTTLTHNTLLHSACLPPLPS